MLIGYARVSTHHQTLGLQQDALEAASCGQVFTGALSGATAEWPGLAQACAVRKPGSRLILGFGPGRKLLRDVSVRYEPDQL